MSLSAQPLRLPYRCLEKADYVGVLLRDRDVVLLEPGTRRAEDVISIKKTDPHMSLRLWGSGHASDYTWLVPCVSCFPPSLVLAIAAIGRGTG
jgi:hypothetical protein